MKTGRLIRIGVLFAGSLIILFWGINFLKGKKFLQPEKTYYAEYSKIGGLTESSPVTLNGLIIGKVSDISLNDFSTGQIMVKFIINYPELELPLGTSAKIISTDLMGTKAIEILLSEASEFHPYEDTLPGLIEGDLKDQVNSQMLPLKRSAENLMGSMDSVLLALQLIFGPDNRENLAQGVESVTQTIQNLEKTTVFLDKYFKAESKKLSYIISNADSLSTDLNDRSEDLHNIITNIRGFSDTLSQIPVNDIANKLNLVLSDMHSLFDNILDGKGNLGKLTQDDSLYMTLKETSESINTLINDIRINPKRYIRLSAIDRGKTIVTSNDSEFIKALNNDLELEYYVCLYNSPSLLSDQDELLKKFKDLSTIQVDQMYYYYIKSTKNLNQARRIVSKHISDYPQASLFTWINGKWHKISY